MSERHARSKILIARTRWHGYRYQLTVCGRQHLAIAGSERLRERLNRSRRDEHPVIDARGMALTVLAVAAAIMLARYMREVLIPFVLAGLVFYALDPIVDWLQRFRVPRAIGAGLALLLVVAVAGATAYSFEDEALEVIEELPAAARKMRAAWAANGETAEPSALEKVQDAARELEKTAAAAALARRRRPVSTASRSKSLCFARRNISGGDQSA